MRICFGTPLSAQSIFPSFCRVWQEYAITIILVMIGQNVYGILFNQVIVIIRYIKIFISIFMMIGNWQCFNFVGLLSNGVIGVCNASNVTMMNDGMTIVS